METPKYRIPPMSRRIVVFQGHPDPGDQHFGDALAEAYRRGAEAAGHTVDFVRIAELEFPLLLSFRDWSDGAVPDDLRPIQEQVRTADHLVFVFPLWLGTLPARTKAFLEQLFRPGFAFAADAQNGIGRRLLKGKSARVIVTMGMPGLMYRWYFGAHGYRNLKRNILNFCGIRPVRGSFVGLVESSNPKPRQRWLARVEALGRKAR
ncbi:MAG: NAD(P)H-dependent oxidoreductase [Woeseiaceae bacterium]|nr:NAD(P)H-dependent oxidoreductase [Woeseiaceae bacterium]